jgi:hypothetical protein
METKICTKCNTEKNIFRFRKVFYKDSLKFYYHSKCKDCRNLGLKTKRRIENPEKYIVKTTKICKDCKKDKNLTEFRVKKGKPRKNSKKEYYVYFCTFCKSCEKLRNIKTTAFWRKGLSVERLQEIYKNHHKHKYHLKYSITLPDFEIKKRITELKASKIPKELIEAKREHIILKRKLKNNEQSQICN